MVQENQNNMKKFVNKNVNLGVIAVVIVLAYGWLLASGAIGIDEERGAYYVSRGMIDQDRVGWRMVYPLFKSYLFVPLWSGLWGVIFFTFSNIFLLYSFMKNFGFVWSKGETTCIVTIIITFPYMAKIAIFNGLLVILGYVILFTALALMEASRLCQNWSMRSAIGCLASLVCVFLFEKAYISFFLQLVVLFVLLKKIEDSSLTFKRIITFGVELVVMIFVAFFLSKLIIFVVHVVTGIPASGYSSGYITYDFSGVGAFIKSFVSFLHSFLVLTAKRMCSLTGDTIYVVCVLGVILLSLIDAFRKRDVSIALLGCAYIISSVLVFLCTGNANMLYRTYCYNYALFIGGTIIYLLYRFDLKGRRLMVFYILSLLVVGNQCREMEKVYYKKSVNYEKDKNLAENILEIVEKNCGRQKTYTKPLVFMGFPEDIPARYGEVEETSMFVWDRNASSYHEMLSGRIFGLYRMLGYSLAEPSSDLRNNEEEIRKIISSMRSFPEEGCVRETEDYIIVKLGSSLCEILGEDVVYKTNGSIRGNIEWISYENNYLSMQGWAIIQGVNSYENNMSLILENDNNRYRLRLDECERKDVTDNISDGNNYDNSGFATGIGMLDCMERGEYAVSVEIQRGKELYLFQTNEIVELS